jgi:hypothetical protein
MWGARLQFGFRKGNIPMSFFPVDRPAANRMNPWSIAFVFANAVGIVLYLLLASRGWRIPEEHGMVPVTGEPFVWALALPVLGIFFLTDAIWGGLLLLYKDWTGRLWWLGTAFVWLIVIGIDFYHH